MDRHTMDRHTMDLHTMHTSKHFWRPIYAIEIFRRSDDFGVRPYHAHVASPCDDIVQLAGSLPATTGVAPADEQDVDAFLRASAADRRNERESASLVPLGAAFASALARGTLERLPAGLLANARLADQVGHSLGLPKVRRYMRRRAAPPSVAEPGGIFALMRSSGFRARTVAADRLVQSLNGDEAWEYDYGAYCELARRCRAFDD